MIKQGAFNILTGGLNGNLSIVCGSQLAAETTTMKISTTTASSTTLLSSPTTAVLSMEPTSAFNITNANIINTTAATLPEGGTCGHHIDEKCKYIYFLARFRERFSEGMALCRQFVDVTIHR